jgi:hypothetical protein
MDASGDAADGERLPAGVFGMAFAGATLSTRLAGALRSIKVRR